MNEIMCKIFKVCSLQYRQNLQKSIVHTVFVIDIYYFAMTKNVNKFSLFMQVLMRLCAKYLFVEKRRNFALDPVANFHLRNGATMWRLNWWADLSPRGLSNSCGIMVNYRYYLEKLEHNSTTYQEKKEIDVSEQIRLLAEVELQNSKI